MSEPLLNLLIQVPIVGAFIYFCITLIDKFLGFLKERDTHWQTWMTEQNNHEREYKARIAAELNVVTQNLSELGGKMDTHHGYVVAAHPGPEEEE